METTGMSCIKYLLFIFNIIFALSGIALIVTGALVLNDVQGLTTYLPSSTTAPPVVLIVAGIIIFVIAFLGCCGAIKENYIMLLAFAVFLLIIFVIEIAVGLTAAVNKDSFKDQLKKVLMDSKENYANNQDDRKLWTQLQSRMECCGIDGPQDWLLGGLFPASCCKDPDNTLHDKLCGPSMESVYKDGCLNKLSMRIREGSTIIMGIGIGIAVIQLAGIILSCWLASSIRKENSEKD